MRVRPSVPTSLCLALALAIPIAATTPGQPAPSSRARTIQSPAARVQLRGLPNFGVVSPHLYRGGQPEDTGFTALQYLGVEIVVNLRHEPDRIAREGALVNGHGMRYVSIPWDGSQMPRTEQVAEFLKLLQDNRDRIIFVHCRRGAERTGVFVAGYRIAREQWTSEQALAEMEAFGFRGLWFGHLKRFVRTLPTLVLSDTFTGPARGIF